MHRTDLDGLRILVTRPAHQAEPLCQLIEQAGGRAIRLPLLEIHDLSTSPAVTARLAHLGDYHLAIFISPNAVTFGLDAIDRAGGLPAGLMLATVGKGSARALERYLGRGPDLVPVERYDSEALLALEPLQQMAGKRILICRGVGGRELLAETLRARGAAVDYLELYRRDCPPPPAGQEWLDKTDIITVTSSEALQNLEAMTPEPLRERLHASPLLVVSERTATLARELGYHREVLITPQAGDEVIVATLGDWVTRCRTTTRERQR